MKANHESTPLNGGVRINSQGFFKKQPIKASSSFADLEVQVLKLSVWQMNVLTVMSLAAIRQRVAEGMSYKDHAGDTYVGRNFTST
ncbi:hypothetical protein N7488_009905 [Penicillium malachiteum]|nr:hypothetical protein N7488_009905 [Penicillium malachiteum]